MELDSQILMIDDETTKYFFPNLDPIGRELRIKKIPYQVIGIIEHQGTLFGMSLDKTAIAPFKSPLHQLTNPHGDMNGMMIQTTTPILINERIKIVHETLQSNQHLHPSQPDNFVMETTASALIMFEKTKSVMTIADTTLPTIGLIINNIMIMNIILITIAKHTQKINIHKSLGTRRHDILNQFLVETATLSTLGTIIKILLRLGTAKVIEAQTPLPTAVTPWSLVAATMLDLVVGIVSGVYPTRQTSLLDPIETLKQE